LLVELVQSHTMLRGFLADPSRMSDADAEWSYLTKQQSTNKANIKSSSSSSSSSIRWFQFCSPIRGARPPKRIAACIVLPLVAVDAQWPPYLRDETRRRELLSRRDWLRCGCPPYCPVRRATPEYVQGTRWYTHDIFFEAGGLVRRFYHYWVKLDVDITMFRPLPAATNLLRELHRTRKIFLHTGYTYNGGGCSNNLNRSIALWCERGGEASSQLSKTHSTPVVPVVAAREAWWRQDDTVYYSNFVISSVAFHTSPQPLALARFLNDEVEDGFFKYRWTDQSLFHKVFGVFVGPREDDFLLDLSWMRWTKKGFRPNAVFYHSKKGKSRSELGKHTKL
jgi:hypothetical protein